MARQPLDHAGDVLELGGVVQGTVEHFLVVGAAGLGALRLFGEGGDEVVVDAGGGEHTGGGRAVLAGVEVAGYRYGLGRRFEVCVVEDDDRGLAAELQVRALEVFGRGLGHLHSGPDGARDGEQLRRWVLH